MYLLSQFLFPIPGNEHYQLQESPGLNPGDPFWVSSHASPSVFLCILLFLARVHIWIVSQQQCSNISLSGQSFSSPASAPSIKPYTNPTLKLAVVSGFSGFSFLSYSKLFNSFLLHKFWISPKIQKVNYTNGSCLPVRLCFLTKPVASTLGSLFSMLLHSFPSYSFAWRQVSPLHTQLVSYRNS